MSEKKAAEKLVEALGIRENTARMRDQMSETVLTPIINHMADELGGDIEEVMEEINTFKETYFQKMSILEEEVISHIVTLYDKYFTEDEIIHIIDFYTSSTGKRMIELGPVFMKELLELSVKHAEQVMKEMEEEDKDKEREREMMENAPLN